MPPVLGPWSPSSRRLWSCEVASAVTFLPSHSTMKLASSPCRNSSITTRAPPVVVRDAQLVVQQHEVDGFMRFGRGHGHDHALACGQAIGLDHDGRALARRRRRAPAAGSVKASYSAVGMRWRFMKALEKALELSSCAAACGGPEHAQPMRAEIVDHARGQRRFGADHRQRDLFLQRPMPQRRQVGDGDVFQRGIERRAAIARARRRRPAAWAIARASRPARVRGRRRR